VLCAVVPSQKIYITVGNRAKPNIKIIVFVTLSGHGQTKETVQGHD